MSLASTFPRFAGRFSYPKLACAAFALAIVIQGLVILRDWRRAGVSAGTAQAQMVPMSATMVDTARIAAAHLFGAAPQAPADESGDALVAGHNLKLTGVIAYPDPGSGLAVIANERTPGRLFPVGSWVGAQTRLVAVYADHAIIEREGQQETLVLPRTFSSPGKRVELVAQAPAPMPVPIDLDHTLGGMIEVVPTLKGKFRGLRVAPSFGERNLEEFRHAGFEPQDLIVAINGVPIQSANQGSRELASLKGARTASVTVIREGARREISLSTY
jgi:type II secretion system protein C